MLQKRWAQLSAVALFVYARYFEHVRWVEFRNAIAIAFAAGTGIGLDLGLSLHRAQFVGYFPAACVAVAFLREPKNQIAKESESEAGNGNSDPATPGS